MLGKVLYSESESAWLALRAEKIAEEQGWPLPIARSEAAAELVRTRASGRMARVVDIRTRFPAPGNITR